MQYELHFCNTPMMICHYFSDGNFGSTYTKAMNISSYDSNCQHATTLCSQN